MEKTSPEYCAMCEWVAYPGAKAQCCDRYTRLGPGFRRGCPIGECDKYEPKKEGEEEDV